MKFFQLEHIRYYDDNDFSDQKIIGIYSSRDLALRKKYEYAEKEGFRNHKDGFSIQELELDTRQNQQKKFYWTLQSVEPYSDNYYDFIETTGLFSTKREAVERKKELVI